MTDMIGVTCRTCGEVNFVNIESRDIVQMAVPLDLYDDVIRLVRRNIPNRPTKRTKIVSDEARARAIALRKEGKTTREIMVEMGWSLGTTARALTGVKR